MGKLGSKLFHMIVAVKGDVSELAGARVVDALVKEIGMTKAPGRKISRYPLKDGQGGVGHTLFQPITESFVCFDAWPDIGGAYLVICSCRRFSLETVERVLSLHGMELAASTAGQVGLH